MRNELIPPLLGYYTMAGGEAAVVPWYLSGGVSASTCLGAWQPKGAADYAASKVNLANPGTYNAADGAAYPTWNVSTGWTFDLQLDQYLSTGIVPAGDQSWSAIARFSNATGGPDVPLLCTVQGTDIHYFELAGDWATVGTFFAYSGAQAYGSPATTSGVLALAGRQGYKNGSPLFDPVSVASVTITEAIVIARSYKTLTRSDVASQKIQAVAIYNTVLTAPQVAAITVAMNLL